MQKYPPEDAFVMWLKQASLRVTAEQILQIPNAQRCLVALNFRVRNIKACNLHNRSGTCVRIRCIDYTMISIYCLCGCVCWIIWESGWFILDGWKVGLIQWVFEMPQMYIRKQIYTRNTWYHQNYKRVTITSAPRNLYTNNTGKAAMRIMDIW